MTPPHPAIAARRARIRRIRARVAAGATALFIALFSGLYVQMASGHDPALGAESAQVATAAASASSTTSTTRTTPDAAPMTTSAS
jgi:hypothetical protein